VLATWCWLFGVGCLVLAVKSKKIKVCASFGVYLKRLPCKSKMPGSKGGSRSRSKSPSKKSKSQKHGSTHHLHIHHEDPKKKKHHVTIVHHTTALMDIDDASEDDASDDDASDN
jgi:hypothetical protein